jgi:putative ABC transport system substrate-binding protein
MIRHARLSDCQRLLVATVLLACGVAHGAEPGLRTVRVGFVNPYTQSAAPLAVTDFWDRLRELGWDEGKNLVIELRSADSQVERFPAIMREMVGTKLDVLVTSGTPAATAAKNATSTVPIVAIGIGDPIGTGLALSLARPGGNLTGLSVQWGDLTPKWLELLQEAIPQLASVAVISNPESPVVRTQQKNFQAIARDRGVKLLFEDVREPGALPRAFRQASQAQAALVMSDPVTATARKQITELAEKYRLPTLYVGFEFMDSGGLMAFGVDNHWLYRRAADYVDKILRGANPADLPVEQPTKFDLIINLKTAKALGLTISPSLLVRANEVIE